MGWGVIDYPSAPRELPYSPALSSCAAKACGKDHLTRDEAWDCADCGKEFCEEHIFDIGGAEGSVHVCLHCATRRLAEAPESVRCQAA